MLNFAVSMCLFESPWLSLSLAPVLLFVSLPLHCIHIKHTEEVLPQSLSGAHLIDAAYSRQGQVSRSLSHRQYNLL